jgi:hypothetical protein
MKIYWTKNSIPELAGLSSEERNRLWKICFKKAMHEWQSKAGIVIAGLFAGIGCMLFGPEGGGIGGGIGGFIFSQIISNRMRPYLIAEIEGKMLKND